MTDPSSITPQSIQRLDDATAEQGIRDLMGLLALPALWAGRDGQTILQITMEAVGRIVPLQFIYAQVMLLPEHPRFDLLHVDGEYVQGEALSEWDAATREWIQTRIPDGRVFSAATPLHEMRIIRLSMGYGLYGGRIWFGSVEPDFPSVNQLAFMRAAASLAATGLQAARADYEREQASRAKDEFLAMLGHELRNPLSPIVTTLELLKLKNNGALSREHQIIERQAHHLSRLVDDLLDVTRITRGKVELRKEPLDLKNILTRAIEDTHPLLNERQHTLTADFPNGDVSVFGDATRLTQIFSNLLTNAAKYTDPGGEIAVVMNADALNVAVVVRDNGMGISPKLFPRLFNIFEQGIATIDRSKGGLGIGLALVKSFVDLHGGTVTASSAGIGKGSEFRVQLPLLSYASGHSAHVVSATRQLPLKSSRVLVVDDNMDALESIKDYLGQRGHVVRSTSNALEALQIASEFKPQVAVLDIGLPFMDGYTLAEKLRAQFSAPEMGLIALTGYGQAKDVERAKQAGFNVHLVKPVSLERLDEAIMRSRSSGEPT